MHAEDAIPQLKLWRGDLFRVQVRHVITLKGFKVQIPQRNSQYKGTGPLLLRVN